MVTRNKPPHIFHPPVWFRLLAVPVLTGLLGACASGPLDTRALQSSANIPAQWQTPLPHGGSVADLNLWWQSLGDPVLADLIVAAQSVSPTLASASARMVQARGTLTGARAASTPTVSANLAAQRGVNASSSSPTTTLQGSLDASWELDIFGGNAKAASAATARLDGALALWHDARVSVAAETANLYFSWRTCRSLVQVLQSDATSRRETARLTELSANAGFTAPATAALAQASAAQSNAQVSAQQAQCDGTIKAMVALTAIEEPRLHQWLQNVGEDKRLRSEPLVSSVPAALLTQRPDLYAAERDVAAASADIGYAEAQRYPRLTLGGSVGTLNYSNYAGTTDLNTWSIGPLSLSLPVFDAGQRAANVQTAAARYEEAASLYRAKVRQAVREVEDALLSLNSADSRMRDSITAQQGYATAFEATQALFKAGIASLPDLEEARRNLLVAQNTVLQLELQRSTAWVNLYRALGGGWNSADAASAASNPTPAPSTPSAPATTATALQTLHAAP